MYCPVTQDDVSTVHVLLNCQITSMTGRINKCSYDANVYHIMVLKKNNNNIEYCNILILCSIYLSQWDPNGAQSLATFADHQHVVYSAVWSPHVSRTFASVSGYLNISLLVLLPHNHCL